MPDDPTAANQNAPRPARPRLAVRGVILTADRLLMVNAWPVEQSDLWCVPGGGVEVGQSLPDTLVREIAEETGLCVAVGAPCLVNEFHDPASGFHQVDIYFRCTILTGDVAQAPADPAGMVTRRRFFSRAEMASVRFKPDSLPRVAWPEPGEAPLLYDPLEPILR